MRVFLGYITRFVAQGSPERRNLLVSTYEGCGRLWVLTGGELVYSVTSSSEGRAIAAHRFNRVIVRRARRKFHHLHAVDHVGKIPIPPVDRFCLATEVLGVSAVMHHRVLDHAAASIGLPPDNGGIMRCRFKYRPLDDLHARGFPVSRRL